jgi:(p)ppGpp synthase/HD superfamily hydrolase
MLAGEAPPFVAGRPLTGVALEWASTLHSDQLRAVDRAPFILHPLEVAALLSQADRDDEVTAAGLLHDVVEGTDAGIDDVRVRFGDRVAGIVAAVSEDPAIEDYEARKAALRAQVAAADGDAHVVFAADKVVKVRELRAQVACTKGLLDQPEARLRLEHYEYCLETLQAVAANVPFVRQLAFELWAMRYLPPG